MKARERQKGLTSVEFAIVGVFLFVILFAIVEFGRVLFTLNVLQEGARRGARVAAVSAPHSTAVADAALFKKESLGDLPALENATVEALYLTGDGKTGTQDMNAMQYVRVSVTAPAITLRIPLVNPTITPPVYSSTLPRESLGVVPD